MTGKDWFNVLFIVLVGAPIVAAVMLGGNIATGVLIGSISTALYVLPMYVAVSRGRLNNGPIFVVDIFLGWTFIGWVVALAMAAGGETETRA